MTAALSQIAATVLVVGCGSIGRRHLRNLRKLEIGELVVCDPDPERVRPLVEELAVRPFDDVDHALGEVKPSLVFVCSPPVFHLEQATAAIRSGADTFIEKPLSHSSEGMAGLLELVSQTDRIVQVGYNLRFHPGVRALKNIVDNGAIGRILWARAEVGHYLPNWRPWQDYRESYTARRELGGGVIFDLSHEIDYVTWMLGDPVQVLAMAGRVSGLTCDVEDSATLLLRFASGIHADVHMDCLQRLTTRVCKLVGEKGTATWDAIAGAVRIEWPKRAPEIISCAADANESYVAEVRHFIDCVATRSTPLIDVRQAARVVEICETALVQDECRGD
jgi:predicted dehydrogenase